MEVKFNMKKLVLFISIFFIIMVTNALSDELVLTTNNCGSKAHDYLELSGVAKIYMCDTAITKVELDSIINYFYNEPCPKEYSNIQNFELNINKIFLSACKPNSIEALNNYNNFSTRIHLRKYKCKSNEETVFNGGNHFAACLQIN